MIKKLLLVWLALIVTYWILVILRVWFNIFDVEFFFKISITFWILWFIDLVTIWILYAIKEDEELKKWNHIW